MKKIESEIQALDWSQHYPSILRCSRGVNQIIGKWILTKFKLVKAFIVELIICKNEEDPFKIESTRVVTTYTSLIISLWRFSRLSRAANSTVQGPIPTNFEPTPDFMGVLVVCKKAVYTYFIATNYSNGVGSQVLATLVTTLPLHIKTNQSM